MEALQVIYHRGTQINKIENEFLNINDEEDFLYVSCGFLAAINRGSEPTTEMTDEWHHLFIKDAEYGFKATKVYFN